MTKGKDKKRPGKKRPVWLRLIFVFTAVILFFAGAELICRGLGLQIMSGDLGRNDRAFYFDIGRGEQSMDIYLVLGVRVFPLLPGQYRIDKPPYPKPDGAFRVVCLGDSSTIGDGVKANETYCAQLEDLLSEKLAPRKVEAINAGFFGYSSFQGLKLMEQYHQVLQPDAVVFYFGANDGVFAPVRQDKDWDKVPPWALKSNHYMYINSSFYRVLRNVNVRYLMQTLVHPFNKEARTQSHRPRVTRNDFFKNLDAICNITSNHGGEVYLVPYLSMAGDTLIQAAYFDNYENDRLIDIRPGFAGILKAGQSPFVDGIHPSPEGHRIIAELLSDKMIADLQLSDKN